MTRVVIVGCGVVGAAIAYELSLIPNLKITVVDRQEPAQECTAAALGVMMGIISHKVKGRGWRLRETSLRRYETLIPELEAIAEGHIPYNRHGILKLCFPGEDMAKWEKLAATRRDRGWPLEILPPYEARMAYPQLADLDIVAAVYSPQDRQVDPVALTRALVAAAERNGVSFQFGVAVEDANYTEKSEKQRICDRVETSNGSLELDWLVVAAGLGSTPLTAHLDRPVDIRPVIGQALQLQMDNPIGDATEQPVITGNDVHIVPCIGGSEAITEYWVGATVEFPESGRDIAGDPALLEEVRTQALQFCPALAQAKTVRTWSGLRPRPEGQPAPIIGPLAGFENVLLATGHYRNGVLLAPATALDIRDRIAASE